MNAYELLKLGLKRGFKFKPFGLCVYSRYENKTNSRIYVTIDGEYEVSIGFN